MGQAGRQKTLRRESPTSPQTVKPTNTSSSPRQRTAFSNRSVNIAGEESVDRWRNRLPHAAIGTNDKLINEHGEAIHRKMHRRLGPRGRSDSIAQTGLFSHHSRLPAFAALVRGAD